MDQPGKDLGCIMDVETRAVATSTVSFANRMIFEGFSSVANTLMCIGVMVSLAIQGNHSRLVFYIATLSLHTTIRSLMDIKYDAAPFEGFSKARVLLQLLLLNMFQLRRPFDCWNSIAGNNSTMSLTLTRVVDALVKNMGMAILMLVTLLSNIWPTSRFSSGWELLFEVVVPILSLTVSIGGTGITMSSFECTLNPKAAQANMIWKTRAYFCFDAALRPLALSYVLHFLSGQSEHALLCIPVSTIYLSRCFLFIGIFVHRGYIYPPKDGTTQVKGLARLATYVGFALFPAAFVQSMTDYPFNGDIASHRGLYKGYHLLSLTESLVAIVFAEVLAHTSDEGPTSGISMTLFRIVVTVAFCGKAGLIPFYFVVKAPDATSQQSASVSPRKADTTADPEPDFQSSKKLRKIRAQVVMPGPPQMHQSERLTNIVKAHQVSKHMKNATQHRQQ